MEATSPVQRSLLSLLIGIIDRPRSTFAQLLAFPRWKWAMPAILVLLATVILLVVSAQLLAEQAAQQQAVAFSRIQGQLESMTEAQREQVRQQMSMFSTPLAVAAAEFARRAVGMFVGWAIGTLIIYFGLVIGGLEIGFGALFSAYTWTSLPFVVRDLVDAAYVAISGTLRVNPGLSYFLSTGDTLSDARNPLWVASGQIDLFFLWHVILVYALIRAARPKGGAVGLTLVYTLVYLALRLLPALLAARLSFG
ncbi:MAG: YIP1 family protein [Anaerolineae bacterium]|nr:YIP1 family protein [Anaerolineae bacterium]